MTDHGSTSEPTLTPFGAAAGTPDEEPVGGRRYDWPPVPLIPTLHNSESKLSAADHAIWRSDPRLARIRLKVKWRSREYVMERADLYGLDARIEDIALSWGGLLHDEKYLVELVHLSDEAGFGIRRVWTSKQWGPMDASAASYPVRQWRLQAGQSGELPSDVADHLRYHNSLEGKLVDERGQIIEAPPPDDFSNGNDYDSPDDLQGFGGGPGPQDFHGGRGFPQGAPGGGGFGGGAQAHPGAAPFQGGAGFPAGHPGGGFPGAPAGFPGPAPTFPAAGFPGAPGGFPPAVPPFPAAPVFDLFGGLPRAPGHVLVQGNWMTEAAYLAMLPRAGGRIYVAGQWLPEPPPVVPPFVAPLPPVSPATLPPDPSATMLQMMKLAQETERERLAAERDAVRVRAETLENQRREDDRKAAEAEARRREADEKKREDEWRRREEEAKQRREDAKAEREEAIRLENQRREDAKVAREEAIRIENQRREDAKAEREEAIRQEAVRREEERRLEAQREARRDRERREAEERQEKFIAALTGIEEKRAKPPSPEMVKMTELVDSFTKTVEALKAAKGDPSKGSALRDHVKALRADAEALGIKLPGVGDGAAADNDNDGGDAKWEKTVDRLIPLGERVAGMAEMFFGKELREADTNAAKYAAEAKKAEAELAKVNAELARTRLETAQQEAAAAHARMRTQELAAQHVQQGAQVQGPFNLPVWPQGAQVGAFAAVPQPTYPQHPPATFGPQPQQQPLAFAPQPQPQPQPAPPVVVAQAAPPRPASTSDDDQVVAADDLL